MIQLSKEANRGRSAGERAVLQGTGTVYLVGAGPGDPELISLKGARLLQQADAIVYDRLVHPDLVDQAPARAERMYVGKAAARKSMSQDGINTLLIELAGKYRTVVRLKGGDPFVYGRGSEEALALRTAGISFEIVPGISSAFSVPAYAGIPLTHRGLAQSFTVVTGHTADPDRDVDWSAYTRVDTLVILMGLRRIERIAGLLVAHGKPAETPAAVISRGSTVEQQVVQGTLADIASRASGLSTPAIIVVGPAAGLHAALDWYRAPERQHAVGSVFTEHIYAVSA